MLATLLVTASGSLAYLRWASADSTLTVIEIIATGLFSILFGWISFSFVVATLGLVALVRRSGWANKSADGEAALSFSRAGDFQSTAILMPIYNESPERVFAGVEAMILSLHSAAALDQFEFYVLSDSTQHNVWLEEESRWMELRERHPGAVVHYRHRPQNKSRKAGNIADFCQRWGDHHELMVVLDADSLMTAGTLTTMVNRMTMDPMIGILQAPPRPLGRQSLFARMQQFAATIYGPVFIEGFAAWTGDYGNYWGHNAIIRVDAFRDHCDLPRLAGRKPLGGEILSHDFVEAALMVRNGWKVQLATDLDGSYEECPTTLTDYAIRDHRWCQGNLQHAKLVVSEGFHLFSRIHFASGVLSYAASPIWLAFTLLCIASMTWGQWRGDAVDTPSSFIPLALFGGSMAMLLLPKAYAVIWSARGQSASAASTLVASALIEIVASILLSPIMAIYHSRFVVSTLAGLSVRWNAQQRDECGVGWREATSQFLPMTILGLLSAAGLWLLSPGLFAWFSPLMAGLWFAIPLAVMMGSARSGMSLRRWGLLAFDDEICPPQVLIDRDACLERIASNSGGDRDWFHDVICDPKMFALHTGIQAATESDIRLETRQTKAIEAAMSAGGVHRIPAEVRSSLLADSETLKALHLEVQTADL